MIRVKKATLADVDTVYDLIIAIAKHHNQTKFVVTSKEQLIEFGFSDNPSFGVLLAEIGGEVAGYCSFTWNYSIWQGSIYMNIDDVFVWERFRGKKIGEALMLEAKAVCVASGATRIKWEVESDNFAAINFYERLGAKKNIKGLFHWDVKS